MDGLERQGRQSTWGCTFPRTQPSGERSEPSLTSLSLAYPLEEVGEAVTRENEEELKTGSADRRAWG